MADILSGLESMGLGNLSEIDLFHDEVKKPEKKKEPEKPKEIRLEEKDFIYDKSVECTCCGHQFKERTIRTGKAKLVSQDMDLRPKYAELDSLKYNVTACPYCGYAALNREFRYLSSGQAKLIKEKISANFSGLKYDSDVYSYDEAITRTKLALVNSVVKRGKLSERAYLCLILGWLTRGKSEILSKDIPERDKMVAILRNEENDYLMKAAEGFSEALLKESFPICGFLDETTFFYLMAALDYETGNYKEALRFVEKILTNKSLPDRIKDKARGIKESIAEISMKNE